MMYIGSAYRATFVGVLLGVEREAAVGVVLGNLFGSHQVARVVVDVHRVGVQSDLRWRAARC